MLRVVTGDALAQNSVAHRLAIAEAAVPQRRDGRLAYDERRGRSGLAKLHMNNLASRLFEAPRLAQHFHRHEGRDGGAAGGFWRAHGPPYNAFAARRLFD